KFAMPYVGPYVIVEVQGLHTAKIRLENEEDTESILVNVDQLSRCYPEFAPKATLDYSRIKKQRRANRKRIGLPQEANISPFHHHTILRNVSNSDFVGDLSAQDCSSKTNSQDLTDFACSIKNLNVRLFDFACRLEQSIDEMSAQPPDKNHDHTPSPKRPSAP
ncbi:MAG: hypothetical protein GY820_45295, partial [Gammaproteobacteria bacterium]|nr:hypothetical protein [Gammaproteobacteria bacterium]